MIAPSAPVAAKARIQSIDTLRGVALLGILLMNIVAFANPFAAYLDPTIDGADTGIDLAIFMTMDIFVEGAMRAIFCMLFGAGMLIFLHKPDSDTGHTKALYFRRTLLLVGFGLFNAYMLLWLGDILYAYGMAGLVLYFFRNMSARTLLVIGVGILLLLSASHSRSHYYSTTLGAAVQAIEALPTDTSLSAQQQQTLEEWDTFIEQQFISPELAAEQLDMMQSGYLDTFISLAPINLLLQTVGFISNGLWDALAMMLLGMAFMKWGLLDASRTLGTYGWIALTGMGVGLILNTWESVVFVSSGFENRWTAFNRPTYELGRLTLGTGYIGLVMMICKLGILSRIRLMLARVGQMALTNYLAHSVICGFIFMGWGMGLAGQLQRHEIYYVVLGIWIFQLVTSTLWLNAFRFGPAEWLWRSLTYKQKQPMRLSGT